MDMTSLLTYSNIIIMGICLCVGYVIKKSLNFIDNKYIPLIMLVLGTILSVLANLNGINLKVILEGMISGISSTGMYEAFKNLIGGKE